ncbi:hypothetical protein B7495_17205 [Cryobacterium sp. LW097]|nr:hypothetical protein B7495_17205 [Cryobacterium sp. LW097]
MWCDDLITRRRPRRHQNHGGTRRRRRRRHPADVCIAAGAFAVVVGTAITHPTTITTWFADAVAR